MLIRRRPSYSLVFVLCFASFANLHGQSKKALTFNDVMKFNHLENTAISDDGRWIAYSVQPDRGDGEGRVYSVGSGKTMSIPRAGKPVFSRNAQWVAFSLKPQALEVEKKAKEKDKPKSGMVLVNTVTGDTVLRERVESFQFSENSAWLAYTLFKEEKKDEKKNSADTTKPAVKLRKEILGSDLVLRKLASGKELIIPFVHSFSVDSASRYLVYVIADTTGEKNGVYVRDLSLEDVPERTVAALKDGYFTHLSWTKTGEALAYLLSVLDEKEKPGDASLCLWQPATAVVEIVETDTAVSGWVIPAKNDVRWSRDGKRLFFGFKPKPSKSAEARDSVDLFNVDLLVAKRELDVWHWNDPRIIPNQKKRWKDVKDQTYRAVYNVDARRYVMLADSSAPVADVVDNDKVTLVRSSVPYLKEITWDSEYEDIYLASLNDGSRKSVVRRLRHQAYLSPGGNYVLYYTDKHWHLYDAKSATTRTLTETLPVAFYDEENDSPSPPEAYGFGGWIEDDAALLLYDKYDIWQIPTMPGEPINLTAGEERTRELTFRIQRIDSESKFYKNRERLLLTAFHNKKKHTAFYSAQVGKLGIERLLEEPKRFGFVVKAKNADRMLFTRQTYSEFPDLWLSNLECDSPKRITDLNPQIKDFAWGSSELVEWSSLDGTPLQGVLIKPGNYEPGKRYPVLVYFYEISSHRLHEFNQVVVNHRPCFPFYASNGYAVFLPDVRYTKGQPGYSATKCIVPGVQKLIDMGVADPKAIGLHGHSWGGYQAAFMISQTNMFAATIAGAPVANMTSAYNGIRLESGLARQFQYEQEQSRIGASLWDAPELYIENSPVFQAHRINTPLLIEFGDEDEAVPWHQGVEMYLAMRRLGKECVLLQYRGEPHHLKKYPNKLDYSIKFKEYFDHYLKGAPAPDWLKAGVGYSE